MQKRLAFLIVAISVFALPLAAQAQHKSPLADAPAIRKRLELRSTRFELGVGGATTIGQDFYHSVFINVKLGFHITDWLSIAGFGGFAVANLDTGFKTSVVGSLPPNGDDHARADARPRRRLDEQDPADARRAARVHAVHRQVLAVRQALRALRLLRVRSGRASSTTRRPTSRRVRRHAASYAAPPAQPTPCAVTGLKLGVNAGVGVHSFINQFLALNFELRDIIAPNNAAGRDVNGDRRVDNNDLTYGNTFVASLNLVLYFPTTADISN